MLTEMIAVRVTAEDKAYLKKVAAKMPGATPHSIARIALRKGLEQMEKEARRR